MIAILLGPSGAGKGTQAKAIVNEFNIMHISTGDIFRRNIEEETEVGKEVKKYLDDGRLVPDSLTIEIVKNRISQNDCNNGFLLDGFPRTINQAKALDEYLSNNGLEIDKVINLHVDDSEIMSRAINRRTCENSECKEIYNLKNNPPKVEDTCDKCGSKLFLRDDDNEETVANRLKVYHNQTEPLIEYYSEKGILATIEGQEELSDTIALVKAELAK